ncbi:MAG: protoporphyrinogen oxidase [Thermodesulfobacteriota bacterium]
MPDIIIIGAGISGLATAFFLRQERPDLELAILEAGQRPGGAIASHHCPEGYLVESGPHGFLGNKEESSRLLGLLGLSEKIQPAPLGAFKRFICRQGRLVALPQSPKELITTPLLGPGGKLRLLAEFFKGPMAGQPTVGQWAAHRFGPAVLPLVDVAVTGTYSGDFQRLLMDGVMPGVRELEKEYGSLLRGLRKRKRSSQKVGLPAMINFPDGMETLVQALAAEVDVSYSWPVAQVGRTEQGWQVSTADGASLTARQLVMALPVNSCLALMTEQNPPLASLPESRICNVALGFNDNGSVPQGFGYLAPECEGRFTLGSMFTSRMFPGRAPRGKVLLEALVGGRRHPERLSLSDQELINGVWADMGQLLDLPAAPEFARVFRPASGIPQMEKGFLELLAWRRNLQAAGPGGLRICGFGWDGIGVNDMIKAASQVAQEVGGGEQAGGEGVEVKPVYF